MRRAMAMMRVVVAMGLGGAALGAAGPVRADDCAGQSVATVSRDGAPLRVEVRREGSAWQARVIAARGGDGPWSPLPEVPEHAHLIVAGPDEGGRFAVVRGGGETDDVRRVLVYGPAKPASGAGALALLRAYDLAELLTADERAKVTRSISHLQWLAWPADGKLPVRLADGVAAVWIEVVGGRAVRIPLDGRALPAPVGPKSR